MSGVSCAAVVMFIVRRVIATKHITNSIRRLRMGYHWDLIYMEKFCERFPCTSVFKTIYLRLNNRPYSRSKVLNHWILLHLCDMIPILHTLVHLWTLNTAVSCSLHE